MPHFAKVCARDEWLDSAGLSAVQQPQALSYIYAIIRAYIRVRVERGVLSVFERLTPVSQGVYRRTLHLHSRKPLITAQRIHSTRILPVGRKPCLHARKQAVNTAVGLSGEPDLPTAVFFTEGLL